MERWCVVSLAVVVMATRAVMAEPMNSTTTAPELIRNDSDTSDPLLVERMSKYCDWERVMGPICIYNTTSQVVVVPEGLMFTSGQLELEIHNASVVKLYPTCVSWVQIYHTGMIHTLPSEENYECRTWLRIYGSKMGRVEYGVKDLTLQESEVDTIKLVDQRDFMAINSTINEIEELDWGGYRSTVMNTTIRWLAGVQARDSWHVVGSRFGRVARGGIVFNAKEMSIINSTINHMSSKALSIKSGNVNFTNVSIAFLDALAITLTSPTGYLSLTNTVIGAAIAPCFVVLDRERLKLDNVTILSIALNESSPFIHFLDDAGRNTNESSSGIGGGSKQCWSNDTVLACNFSESKKDMAIVGEDIKTFKVVHVSNAESLLVSSTGCQTDLRLENVNATLPHLTTLPGNDDGACNVSISVKNSSLNVVWTQNINNFNVTTSNIKRIHGGSLDSFMLSESSVEQIDEVEVRGRGAVWVKSIFLSSVSITFKAPLTSSNVDHPHGALTENSIIIDHPGETTTVKNWSLGWMQRHSVVVKNGSRLELSDVVAVRVVQEAIYLEEGATVSSKNFRILHDAVYIFSVASRDQVEILDDILSVLPHSLVHVRSPPPPVDQQSNFTVSDTHVSAYCRTIPYYLQICDFSSAPKEEEVTVDFANSQVSNRVVIKGANSVTLFPSCVEKVILMNVKTASTTENERECGTWLEALGVHLINVTSGVHDVTLKACTVDLLAPDRRLRDVDLEGTSVEQVVGVHWAGYTGVFNSSTLGEVRSLRADSRLMMSNSKVERLVAGGMFLAAEAIIVNTTFKEIRSSGMTVNGSTRMQDVTIEKLEKGGIKVLDGLLLLVNVRILETEGESITAAANGGISFKNVTVGGKKVHWRGYLTRKNSSKQSVVFLNKHFNESIGIAGTPLSRTTTTTSTSSTTTELRRPSPKASSMIQWRTKSVEAETRSSVAPEAFASDTTSSSWKWAGAGIGFCMGLLVGCCIFIVVKVVKPNKGMLMLPTVFWRVKDDQHELLQEDQNVEEPAGARRDQGYSALPRSDI